MQPTVKLRDLNSDRSTMGFFSVNSQITHATKAIAATAAITTIAGDPNQSASLPVSSITWKAPTHTSNSMKPVVSTGSLRVGVSRLAMLRQHRNAQRAPTGRLIRKIHCQLMLSDM